MPRGQRLARVRVGDPQVVPMTNDDYERAVSALATLIAAWVDQGSHQPRRVGSTPKS